MPAEALEVAPPLTDAQVARFHQDGFVSVTAITTPEEVDLLRGIFTRLFSSKAGREQGAQFDMVGYDEDDEAPAASPQILHPVRYAPELRETRFRVNALAIARRILGPTAEPGFEHAILKPALYGAPTPWHQDEASREDPQKDYEQVSIWMPLQPVSVENGCMHFVPGSHREGVLPHRSLNDDPRIHAIECAVPIDPARVVPCPLPAGGATIHHGRTLHYAGPNESGGPRAAYVLAFRTPPRPGAGRTTGYPWMQEKCTARLARQRAARRAVSSLASRALRKVRRLFGV